MVYTLITMRRYFFPLVAVWCLLLFVAPTITLAQAGTGTGIPVPGTGVGVPGGGDPAKTPTIDNPLGRIQDPRALLGKIIGAALGVVGSISLVIFLYGGFTWMTSGGSPDRVKHGRDLIVWASIGLFVIFASFAMVRWVLDTITESSK